MPKFILESSGHLDHPEDSIFLGGATYATTAVDAIVSTVKNPKAVTIKWDGYPALIFGRDSFGKFTIMDKHMFNKKDGSGRTAFNPRAFVQYDRARGVDRSGLYPIIQAIWPGLERECHGNGFYWGDLLFSSPLQEQDGVYKFRPNPNGIAYSVDVQSEIGKLMTNKVAGIAVHQYIDPNSPTTDQATSLNGGIGQLKNDSNVAIVPSAMPTAPALKISPAQVQRCNQSIQKYGEAATALMAAPAGTVSVFNSNLFTVYINRKVVAGNLSYLMRDFMAFFNSRPMNDQMREKILAHLEANKQGLAGAFLIWGEIYKLKMSLVKQLDAASKSSPVKGFLQDGTQTQEGFVANGFKFVDRMGFSRQNLAARAS